MYSSLQIEVHVNLPGGDGKDRSFKVRKLEFIVCAKRSVLVISLFMCSLVCKDL